MSWYVTDPSGRVRLGGGYGFDGQVNCSDGEPNRLIDVRIFNMDLLKSLDELHLLSFDSSNVLRMFQLVIGRGTWSFATTGSTRYVLELFQKILSVLSRCQESSISVVSCLLE